MIPSISYNQHDILRWINKLHLNGEWIACDPCYGKGNFYKPDDIPEPRYRYDIHAPTAPETLIGISKRDCRELPFSDNELVSIMFDPPFLSRTGKGSIIKDRFGEYPSMLALWQFYGQSLTEFSRILQPKGHLIFKCQNTVMGGKQWWSHFQIQAMALDRGLNLVDEFVLLAKNRMERKGNYTQRHARKFHSYFLVFQK